MGIKGIFLRLDAVSWKNKFELKIENIVDHILIDLIFVAQKKIETFSQYFNINVYSF